MTKTKFIVIILATIVAFSTFCSCSSRGGSKAESDSFIAKKFPEMPNAPSAYTDSNDKLIYVLSHYWDKFISEYKSYPTDSTMLCGVKNEDVEYALGTFVTLLESGIPTSDAQQIVKSFFDEIESTKAEDSNSKVFDKLVEFTSKYLYDPNSPVRDEDLYLPFVKRLSESKYTNPDMVPAYQFDASMCSLNQKGTPAADFSFKSLSGKIYNLYGIKADYTLLFFSNPGCPSCKEIIEALQNDSHVSDMIASGKLAVVNIYIDQEIDKWKDYASQYPKQWLSGYDYKYLIRTNSSYNVRAIPSLYILDANKCVIMKDAPQDKVINYLNSL